MDTLPKGPQPKDIILLRVINNTLLNVCSNSIDHVPRSVASARNKWVCRGNFTNCSVEGYNGQPQPVYVQQRGPGNAPSDDLCFGMYVPHPVPYFA